ncbi:hypothetical protein ACHAWF_014613 [Thalassiosira exigua]
MREVVLRDGLQKIGKRAFAFCTSLECVTVPSTVSHIERCAFRGCTSLRTVQLCTKTKKIELIRQLINYFELVEASTILELALWKAQIEEDTEPKRDVARRNTRKRSLDQMVNYNAEKQGC